MKILKKRKGDNWVGWDFKFISEIFREKGGGELDGVGLKGYKWKKKFRKEGENWVEFYYFNYYFNYYSKVLFLG
jgi:hypothetical protein